MTPKICSFFYRRGCRYAVQGESRIAFFRSMDRVIETVLSGNASSVFEVGAVESVTKVEVE